MYDCTTQLKQRVVHKMDGNTTLKKAIAAIVVGVFLVLSCLAIIPMQHSGEKKQARSTSLQKVVTIDGNVTKTDYIDSEGRLTYAVDAGYATMTITDTGDGTLEEYYDETGSPICYKSNTYYAVFREYDENGNNTLSLLLDKNHNPVMANYGYARIERTFTENGQIESEAYFDADGNPVCSTVFGHKKINEHDAFERISRQTYVDIDGRSMITGLGYASVKFVYEDDDQRPDFEFYYGTNGEPISLSLGQYGIYKEYDVNDLVSLVTYLDADGNPIATIKGYSTIVRTFHEDNTVATERYYDVAGNPYSLADGQYGVKRENGKTIYLDEQGNEIFSLRMLLSYHIDIVILMALIVVVISCLLPKRASVVLLIIYLGVILYLTLMHRDHGFSHIDFNLFWSYKKFFTDSAVRNEVLNNIWLFIPLGTILYSISTKKRVLLIPILLSIIIEILQYIIGTGLCELDDVVSNELGGVIGYVMGKGLTAIKALKPESSQVRETS